MNFNVWISFVAATVTAGIAVLALWRDPRSFVHRVFAAGDGAVCPRGGAHRARLPGLHRRMNSCIGDDSS